MLFLHCQVDLTLWNFTIYDVGYCIGKGENGIGYHNFVSFYLRIQNEIKKTSNLSSYLERLPFDCSASNHLHLQDFVISASLLSFCKIIPTGWWHRMIIVNVFEP